jgi:hypothetical protein
MEKIIASFRWRLDQGKWADLLLEALPQFLDNNATHDWEFHIIGTGIYYNDFVRLSHSYPQIKLYWRSSRNQIKTIASQWQYCLCPSTFLETFGMTALEWCKLWLPIIGPSKWGLEQFTIAQIGKLRTQDNTQSIISQLQYIDQHHDQQYHSRQQQTLSTANQFWPTNRLEHINNIL